MSAGEPKPSLAITAMRARQLSKTNARATQPHPTRTLPWAKWPQRQQQTPHAPSSPFHAMTVGIVETPASDGVFTPAFGRHKPPACPLPSASTTPCTSGLRVQLQHLPSRTPTACPSQTSTTLHRACKRGKRGLGAVAMATAQARK